MKYKTIASIYQQEELPKDNQFKISIFKLFQLPNESREITFFIGHFLLTLCFLQIVSLLKFHLPNEEIDEFAKSFNVLSYVLNYTVYFYRENLTADLFSALEILVYVVFGFIVLLFLTVWIIIYTNLASSNSILLIVFQYVLQFIQWIGIVPPILILSQVDFNKDNIAKDIIHTLIMVIHFIIGLTVAYFNLISSTTPVDFFNANDNCIPLDIFALQIISLVFAIIINHSDKYLFMGYIIVFCFLLKMSYDAFTRFLFYKRELAIYLNVLICLLYERLMNSIIIKYTQNSFGQAFHSYYVPSLLVVVVFYFIGTQLTLRHISNYALENNSTSIKSVSAFVCFAESLLFVMKDPMDMTKIKKVGYIINHLNECHDAACPLRKQELYLPKTCIFSSAKAKIYNDQVREVHLIMELYKKYYKAFRFDFDFILSLLQFMLFFIGNYELLLIEIETATKYLSLTTYQEYLLLLFKSYANNFIVDISENAVSQNVSSGQAYWSVLIMLNVLTYDKILRQMRHYIYLCLDKKRQLWKLIENEDIIIEELFEIGNEFLTYKTNLNIMWEQLNLITNNNPDGEITNLYCDYLANICEDTLESEIIIEKVKPSFHQTPDEIFNNKYKSDTGIVIIKGNKEISLGKITYINESLTKILGYNSREELIGNNIKHIVPGTIGKHHNTLLTNYFEKGHSDVLKKTLGLCLKTKAKFLLPVHLLATFIPNFEQQIQGIGLIRHKTNISETIICSEDGSIEGATVLISQLLNITPNFIEKDKYYIQGFFPQLMKPDKNGIPKLFTEEFKTVGKKNEFKVELLTPEQNQIDPNKITIKTKSFAMPFKKKTNLTFGKLASISHNQSNSMESKDYSGILSKNDKEIPAGSPVIKKIRNANSISFVQKEDNIVTNDAMRANNVKRKQTDEMVKKKQMAPFPSVITERRGSRSFTSSKSNLSISSQTISPLTKKTPEIDQILSYQHDFKKKSLKNLTPGLFINKLDNIYESIISLHSNYTYNPKVEISIIHVCMKILSNCLHIITIPSESLFEIKKDEDNFLSAFSNAGIDNLRMPQNSKEKLEAKALEENIPEGSHISRLDQFEVDSLSSGKDSNLLLEKHLKEMKGQTKDKYNTDKIIGVLMALIMIVIVFIITLLTNEMFSFVKQYIVLSHKTFRIQYHLVDISKYSCLMLIQSNFNIDPALSKYSKDNPKMLLDTAELILSEIEPFLITFRDIFGYDFINTVYNKPISFSFRNYKVSMDYINGIYFMIDNCIAMTRHSVQRNIENFLSLVSQHWGVILRNFNMKYTEVTDQLFRILYVMILVGLILIFVLLLVLFLSYKSKKTEQIGILSAYEKFITEDVNYLLNKIELFERRYIDLFRHDPDFKKKKVKFDTKNSNLLNKNNQQRLIKKQEAQKSKYNILGMAEDPNALEDNGTNKELILRENMTLKYIISVILIFSFCLLYSICLFALSLYYYNMSYYYKEIASKLHLNRYLLNYESYKFDHSFLSNSDIINENKFSIVSIKISLNVTHSLFNTFSSLVTTHSNLFDSNITEIMAGDLCGILKTLPSCARPELSYTLKKGLRSFVSFYLKTLEEAYTYYSYGFSSVLSLPDIFMNDKVSIQRFIIEDIVDVYDELCLQLYSNLDNKLKSGLITIVITVVVLVVLFLIAVAYKLRTFIESIKQDEILCNKLIGEIPIDVVKSNSELRKCLNSHCKQE